MYVCVCLAVTESEVASAITGGARTRDEVTQACRAGGDCGACHGMIATMLDDRACERASSPGVEESGPQLVGAAALLRGRTRAA